MRKIPSLATNGFRLLVLGAIGPLLIWQSAGVFLIFYLLGAAFGAIAGWASASVLSSNSQEFSNAVSDREFRRLFTASWRGKLAKALPSTCGVLLLFVAWRLYELHRFSTLSIAAAGGIGGEFSYLLVSDTLTYRALKQINSLPRAWRPVA